MKKLSRTCHNLHERFKENFRNDEAKNKRPLSFHLQVITVSFTLHLSALIFGDDEVILYQARLHYVGGVKRPSAMSLAPLSCGNSTAIFRSKLSLPQADWCRFPSSKLA